MSDTSKVLVVPHESAENRLRRARVVIAGLLLLLLAVYFAELALKTWMPTNALREQLHLDGRGILRGQWWTPLSYSLLHFDAWHLTLNLCGLALFGFALAESRTWRNLLVLVLASGLGGAGLWVALHHGQRGAVIGASAILCGFITTYSLEHPQGKVPVLGTGLSFPRWIFFAALLAIEGYGLAQELRRQLSPQALSHSAHLGGVAVAVVMHLWIRLRKPRVSKL